MTAYATPDQVRMAVARDPDKPVGSAATLGVDQLQQVISEAQAEVDGRLRPRYVVPFTAPVPGLVQSLTVDIAAYLAGLTFYQEKDMKDTDPIVRRYTHACCILKDIASGFVVLDVGGAELLTPTTSWYGVPIAPHGNGWLTDEFTPWFGWNWWPP